MTKKYNLSSKSDMRKFERDLEKELIDSAKSTARNALYDMNCPHCEKAIRVPAGLSRCPQCGGQINLELDFNIKS